MTTLEIIGALVILVAIVALANVIATWAAKD